MVKFFPNSGAADQLVPEMIKDQKGQTYILNVKNETVRMFRGSALSATDKRNLYLNFLRLEQFSYVSIALRDEVAKISDISFLVGRIVGLLSMPVVKFPFFGNQVLSFYDFRETSERIEKGRQVYEIGMKAGLPIVEKSLDGYLRSGLIDQTMFDPVTRKVKLDRLKTTGLF